MTQSSSPATPPRVFRRGDVIYRAGEPVTHIYMVQSGLASVQVERGDKAIEIAQVGASQVLGEEALFGAQEWSASAIANNEVRAVPIDVASARALLGSGSQLAKVHARGLMEKLRAWSDELVGIKLENDSMPCPPDRVVKLFASIHTTASYTGTRKGDAVVVVWPSFKKYSQRTFLESPVRLEHAVYILVKFGYARLEYIPCETDPEAPDELGFVHFTDLDRVKSFYEFYRRRQFGEPGAENPLEDTENLAILLEIEAWNENGGVEPPSSAEGGSEDAAA